MRVLFLVDNVPAMEMFEGVIKSLPPGSESVFINYGEWTRQSRNAIGKCAEKMAIRCDLMGTHSRVGVASILRQENPDIVVMAREETTPIESRVLQLCRKRGTPTLLVPHGVILKGGESIWGVSRRIPRLHHFRLLLRQGKRKLLKGDKSPQSVLRLLRTGLFRIRNDFQISGVLSRYTNYTQVASYGEAMSGVLVAFGVSPERIAITGNPKFDALWRTTYKNRINGNGRHTSWGRPTVLLVTDYLVEFGMWSEQQRRDYVLSALKVVTDLRQVRGYEFAELVIKIHPVNECVADYDKILRSTAVKVYKDAPIADLLPDCDVVITLLSAAGVEAMAAGKPLIIYDPYNNTSPYREEDGAFVAHDPEELRSVLETVVAGEIGQDRMEKAKDFVYKQAYLQDGKAADRISDLIIKMVKERAQ